MNINSDTANIREIVQPFEIADSTQKGYKRTKLGWIPEDWEYLKIKDLGVITSGTTPLRSKHKEYFDSGNIHWVKTTDLNNGLLLETEEKITERALNETSLKILPAGTVLIAMYGGFNQIGRTGLLTIESTINQALSAIIANDKIILSKYLLYWLNQNVGRWKNFAASSRKDPNITKNDVASFAVLIPPLPEQKAIAQILSTWDKSIETLTQLITQKQQKKKALMQQLLSGKKRFHEFVTDKRYKETKIGLVPIDWKVKKAKDIYKSVSIKNKGNEELLAVTQDQGVIPRNMLEGRVMSPSGSTDGYKLVVPGNFVISLRSFQGGLEYSQFKGIVSPAYTILKEKVELDKAFFKFFFKSPEFISRLSVAVIGIRDGKQIAFDDFGFMDFRFPSLEEQKKISQVLQLIDKEINLLQQKLQALKKQKKGLMQQLLTGKKRVKL